MQSALLNRIRELGARAQMRDQHPANMKALFEDINQFCVEIAALVRRTEDLCRAHEILSKRVSFNEETLSVRIENLDRRKKNKWGFR